MSGSIEDALLAHLVGERPDPRALVVTYSRVDTPESSDPRGPVLRPRAGVGPVSTPSPSASAARHGRRPSPQPLVEPDATVDATMPAVAGLLEYDAGQWRLRNLTSRPAHRTHLRAAGFVLDLGAGPGVAIRHRMTFASVIGRSVDADDRPVVSEHRFLLLRPGGRTPAPPSPVAPASASASTKTLTKGLRGLGRMDPQRTRLMAAFAYPELLGLGWRPVDRGRMVRRLLGQAETGPDPNDRTLTTLRKTLARGTGLPLEGRAGTATFLDLLRQRPGRPGPHGGGPAPGVRRPRRPLAPRWCPVQEHVGRAWRPSQGDVRWQARDPRSGVMFRTAADRPRYGRRWTVRSTRGAVSRPSGCHRGLLDEPSRPPPDGAGPDAVIFRARRRSRHRPGRLTRRQALPVHDRRRP